MNASAAAERFDGKFYSGTGDVEYLQLLDTARRMFAPDPEFQNMPMLYTPNWNGLVEGPTWGAWWIQNSYGTTYCALPFYQEPFVTFLQNSQDLWFDQMGDGKRAGANNWVAPDGCLCDAASPGWIYYRQGDGRIDIHDWGMEFTAAGLLMQAELLLISRDQAAIAHYLPRLERCANFIESRRDPKTGLFLAGPAGNLLAPSFAGYKKPDGTYGKACLTGLSITYIAALDRLIELEKMAEQKGNGRSSGSGQSSGSGHNGSSGRSCSSGRDNPVAAVPDKIVGATGDGKIVGATGNSNTVGATGDERVVGATGDHKPIGATVYQQRREAARKGLATATEPEGYFVRSIDPDGTRHGVFGAKQYGYFEASPNHDAICFGVVDDAQAKRIYNKIASIPGLRPHDFIIPNYPSYDDMYEKPEGLWGFGTWVNGGHWSTCEARMVMAYYRLGKYEDARKSMRQLLTFARKFRMDNPLTKFGSDVYQPNEPVNLCYDTFGPAAAMVRGLFEYLYRADGLTLVPHVPPSLSELRQRFPIRFGAKQLYLSTVGTGPITGVRVNGRAWRDFDERSVHLAYDATPASARIVIYLGGAAQAPRLRGKAPHTVATDTGAAPEWLADLDDKADQLRAFGRQLAGADLAATPEAAHAALFVDYMSTIHERRALQGAGKLAVLPEPTGSAADQQYINTANNLYAGLQKVIASCGKGADPTRKQIAEAWKQCAGAMGWYNIRSEGVSQSFGRRAGVARMRIAGRKDASCGWALDLPEPLTLPQGAKLVLELNGSPGAKFFVDLMTQEHKIIFQTLWKPSPQARETVSFDTPVGGQLGEVILYTMKPDADAYNDFARVQIVGADGGVLASFIPAG